ESDLRRLVGAARGDQRLAAGLDLADAGDHGLVGVAGVAVQRAAGLFELLFRDVAARQRFTHARLGGAAGEDRHGKGQADAVALAWQAGAATATQEWRAVACDLAP